tara:strand:- start:2634 stop:2855 length:222 start_codon:yes stop_codon:yes gene_type:complete
MHGDIVVINMHNQHLSLENITESIRVLMSEIDELDKEKSAVFIYGIFLAQKENTNFTLQESIEYSKTNWSDLF